MENKQKTWADYPYQFLPDGKLTANDITQLLSELFAVKAFPREFVDGLPKELQKHFSLRNNPEAAPTKEKT